PCLWVRRTISAPQGYEFDPLDAAHPGALHPGRDHAHWLPAPGHAIALTQARRGQARGLCPLERLVSRLVVGGRHDRRHLGGPAALEAGVERLAGEAIALVEIEVCGAEVHRVAQESGIRTQVDDLHRPA